MYNTFRNVSFNKSRIILDQYCSVYVQWYLNNVTVLDKDTALPVDYANVTVKNRLGSTEFSELTDSNGFIDTKILDEYRKTNNSYYYYTNYTFNTTKYTYKPSTMQFNITYSQNLTIFMEPAENPAPACHNKCLKRLSTNLI